MKNTKKTLKRSAKPLVKSGKHDQIIRASELPPKQHRHGPKAEGLKISGDWISAVDTALKVKRPPQGWPKK